MTDNTISPKFRVSYPQVFRPKKNDLNGKDEYSMVALFGPKEDIAVLKKAATDAIVEKWGADKTKWPANLRSPFRKHEEKEKEGKLPDGMEAGGIFITLRSIQRPGLVDGNRQPIIDETGFYAGCYARAQVRAYAYDQKGNRGVAFGFQNVQKMADGDPIAGRQRAEDAFEPVADTSGAGSADPFA
jgi:hypothetical protein